MMCKLNKILILITLLCLGLVFVSLTVLAAQSYPESTRTVEVINPWGAGGGTDVAIRGFFNYVEKSLGTKLYVKNITGAISGIGILELMHSRPDGYTIGVLTYDSVVTVPFFGLIQGYDLNKLEFLGIFTDHSFILTVRADAPWDTLEEFIADARNRPDEIKVSNVGIGSGSHVASLAFEKMAGVSFHHVGYSAGDAAALEALAYGEVDASMSTAGATLVYRKSGDIKVLATASLNRNPRLPEVPTFRELGYDLLWGSFRVAAVPAGTPEEIIVYLEKTLEQAFHDEDFQKWADERALGQIWMGKLEANEYIATLKKNAFEVMDVLVKEGVLYAPKI